MKKHIFKDKFPGSILNRGSFYGEGSCLGTAQQLTTPATTEMKKAMTYANEPTSFPLERVAALKIAPNFDGKSGKPPKKGFPLC